MQDSLDEKDTQQQMKAEKEETATQQDEKEEDTSAAEEDGGSDAEKQNKENQEGVAVQETPNASTEKRKLDALTAEPLTSEIVNTKKARTSLLKSPPTRVLEKKPLTARKVTKIRDFSFARPTASSASRTAANASAHAQVKATTGAFLVGKPLQAKSDKHVPAQAQSVPASKMTARPHFGYTPYTGPLPPLTVESSFAPKN